jgi:RND family efflux transporter MFP subunit
MNSFRSLFFSEAGWSFWRWRRAKNMQRLRIWWVLGLVSLVVMGCPNREQQEQAKAQMALLTDPVQPVTVVKPETRPIELAVEVSGPLEASQKVVVGAKQMGRLSGVFFEEGQRVRKGQLLAQLQQDDFLAQLRQAEASVERARQMKAQAEERARIAREQTEARIQQAEASVEAARAALALIKKGPRSQEIERAEQQVRAARARVDKAKADWERAQKLYAENAISRADLDSARLAYETAQADLRAAEEMLAQLREGARPEEIRQAEAQLAQAEHQLRSALAERGMYEVYDRDVKVAESALREALAQRERALLQYRDSTIYAPIDGFVAQKAVEVGQVVQPGSPVATIVALGSLYMEGQVPEKAVQRVKPGQEVSITLDALGGKRFRGRVESVNPVGETLGRMFKARIQILHEGENLRVGMFARARILIERVEKAKVLPVGCLHQENGRSYVYVVRSAGDGKFRAEKLDVTTGLETDGWVEVKGVPDEAEVILEGGETVQAGSLVRIEKGAK